MFALFLTALVLSFFLLVAATPLVHRSRLWSIPAGILALIAAVCATGAAVLATIMSVGAKIALTSVDALNISADVGVAMFVLIWLGTVCIDVAAIFHMAMACFCAPHKESAKAHQQLQADQEVQSSSSSTGAAGPPEKRSTRPRLPDFMIKKRRKNGGHTETVENSTLS